MVESEHHKGNSSGGNFTVFLIKFYLIKLSTKLRDYLIFLKSWYLVLVHKIKEIKNNQKTSG